MPPVLAVEGARKGSSCCLLLPALLLGGSPARHRELSITLQTGSCLHRRDLR